MKSKVVRKFDDHGLMKSCAAIFFYGRSTTGKGLSIDFLYSKASLARRGYRKRRRLRRFARVEYLNVPLAYSTSPLKACLGLLAGNPVTVNFSDSFIALDTTGSPHFDHPSPEERFPDVRTDPLVFA